MTKPLLCSLSCVFVLGLAASYSAMAGDKNMVLTSEDASVQLGTQITLHELKPVTRNEVNNKGGPLTGSGPTLNFISTNDDPEGDMPREVAFTPDGQVAVVVNRDTDNMVFFDVNTRTITHTVGLGDFPVDVAVTPDGQYAIAPNVFSDTVSIVDIATHTVVANVAITGTQPFRVAVTSDSSQVIVGVINDGVNSSFSVIDLGSMSEVLSFPSAPQGVFGFFFTPESGTSGNIFTQFALSGDDSTIVLPDRGNAQVVLYDPATGTELAVLATSALPTAVDISDDSTVAVISHEGAEQRVSVIDIVGQSVSASHATGVNLSSQVIRITPDKTHAIAAISNNTIFVRLSDGVVTATLFTGVVGDIQISFDGTWAFISNFNVRIIDIATQIIVRTLPFAACVDAAISPVEHRAIALNNRFREDVQFYNTNGVSSFVEGKAQSGEPPEGDATRSIAVSADGTTAVAVNNTSDNVSIIDLDTQTVEAYIDTGERSLGVAITPDGTHALVANINSDTVSIIDLSSNTLVANLSVIDGPTEIVISPDSQTAYVSSIVGSDRIHFINLDGANSTVTGSISAGQMGGIGYTYSVFSGIALSPDGSTLAACISFADELLLIDTNSQTEIVRVPVGDFPIRVAFSPDGSRAYVANSFSDDVYEVIIDAGHSSVESIVSGIEFPLTVTVDATGSFVYAGSWDFANPSIKVINTATNSVVGTVALSSRPRSAHLSEADSILYVMGTGSELFTIDAAGAASSILETIPLTSAGSEMAFSDAKNRAAIAQPIPDGIDLISFGVFGDLNGDGIVNTTDLLILFSEWGLCADCNNCPADLNDDCTVNTSDLLLLFSNWG